MSEPTPLMIQDDPELQAEILRAAHALLVAFVNREDGELVNALINELIHMHEAALLVALGEAHSVLRIALDAFEEMHPGFRKYILRTVGAGLTNPT